MDSQPEQITTPETAAPPPLEAPARSCPNRWVLLLVIALTVGALDQASKHWAQETLQHRPGRTVVLLQDHASLSYVRNPGAAWGFLARADDSFRRPFFMVVTLVAMVFIFTIFRRLEPDQVLLMVALALVLGGALGNFIDRVRFNYVVDFILLHWRHRYRWPTFNVADVAITLGVIALLAEMLLGPYLQRRRDRAGAP